MEKRRKKQRGNFSDVLRFDDVSDEWIKNDIIKVMSFFPLSLSLVIQSTFRCTYLDGDIKYSLRYQKKRMQIELCKA